MNPTLAKFNYPATLVYEYSGWVVLLRPDQLTLGSLVIASTSDAIAFGALSPAEYAELGTVIADVERVLARRFDYDKINYIMLMLNDPNPHFHALPRYAGAREFAGRSFEDACWPKPPDMGVRLDVSPAEWEALRLDLAEAWVN